MLNPIRLDWAPHRMGLSIYTGGRCAFRAADLLNEWRATARWKTPYTGSCTTSWTEGFSDDLGDK